MAPVLRPISIDRMFEAVELVHRRLLRSVRALEATQLRYAVADGLAASAWVATVDPGAIRFSMDVQILVGPSEKDAARRCLLSAGFVAASQPDCFLDDPDQSLRTGVKLLTPGEHVSEADVRSAVLLPELVSGHPMRVLALPALVRMNLTTWRTYHRVLVRDLIDVGLVEATFKRQLSDELANRLQHLLDTPDG